MEVIANFFYIFASICFGVAGIIGTIMLIAFAYMMHKQDKEKRCQECDELRFKGMSRRAMRRTTRVLLAKDAKYPKRARYAGKITIV